MEQSKEQLIRQVNELTHLNNVIRCTNQLLRQDNKELTEELTRQQDVCSTIKRINKNRPKKTYLIKENNTSFYKIGRGIKPTIREHTLQRQQPTINVVKVWDKDIEKILHKKYSEQRIRGEWFELTPIQVKYICTHY